QSPGFRNNGKPVGIWFVAGLNYHVNVSASLIGVFSCANEGLLSLTQKTSPAFDERKQKKSPQEYNYSVHD
ncbi:MAG: hypothetical protein ACLFUH_10220, partial [Bacteroidales bacterium]